MQILTIRYFGNHSSILAFRHFVTILSYGQIQKFSNPECDTPSSRPFRIIHDFLLTANLKKNKTTNNNNNNNNNNKWTAISLLKNRSIIPEIPRMEIAARN
jgi:hypothetical protein